jgi:hypothetical protein
MGIGNVSVSVGDGALGQTSVLDLPPAVVGCCSSGSAATPALVASGDDLVSAFGQGPLVELAALLLAKAGGPIVVCKAATATAGFAGGVCQKGAGSPAAGTLTATGTNTSTAIPALTGTADKPYAIKVVVTKAGSNLAATPEFKLSLDGGVTFLPAGSITASATPQAIGSTGLLIGWTDGTFVLADDWTAYKAGCATTGAITGTSEPTVSGAARDSYHVRIQVVRAGASLGALSAGVKVSIDDGRTWGPELAVPVSGALTIGNTGLTVTFGAGTFVVGDEFRFACSPPAFDNTGLTAALTALETTSFDHEYVHVVGAVDDTGAGAVKTSIEGLVSEGLYRWFLVEARDQVTGETLSTWLGAVTGSTPGFAAFTSKRGAVGGGYSLVTSAGIGGEHRRPVSWPISARLAKLSKVTDNVGLAEHPGRVRRGAMEAVVAGGLAHDVRLYPTLDTRRFLGLQSIQGRTGYYATARTAAPDGSDFTTVMNVRVMCLASRAAQTLLTEFVNDNVRTAAGGVIDSRDADAIDGYLTAKLSAALLGPGYVSAVSAAVNRTDDIATTSTLRVKIRVQPLGYATTIEVDIAFALNLTGN